MHETNVSREEVLRRMLHLAAGKANDPVKLAYLPAAGIVRLRLSAYEVEGREVREEIERQFAEFYPANKDNLKSEIFIFIKIQTIMMTETMMIMDLMILLELHTIK